MRGALLALLLAAPLAPAADFPELAHVSTVAVEVEAPGTELDPVRGELEVKAILEARGLKVFASGNPLRVTVQGRAVTGCESRALLVWLTLDDTVRLESGRGPSFVAPLWYDLSLVVAEGAESETKALDAVRELVTKLAERIGEARSAAAPPSPTPAPAKRRDPAPRR